MFQIKQTVAHQPTTFPPQPMQVLRGWSNLKKSNYVSPHIIYNTEILLYNIELPILEYLAKISNATFSSSQPKQIIEP